MGKTVVTCIDRNSSTPEMGSIVLEFNVYNEAMSYAKNASSRYWNVGGEQLLCYVWNWEGGSGVWIDANFSAQENMNYPS